MFYASWLARGVCSTPFLFFFSSGPPLSVSRQRAGAARPESEVTWQRVKAVQLASPRHSGTERGMKEADGGRYGGVTLLYLRVYKHKSPFKLKALVEA